MQEQKFRARPHIILNNGKGRKAEKLTEKGEKHFYRFSLQAEQGVILSSASQILPNRR